MAYLHRRVLSALGLACGLAALVACSASAPDVDQLASRKPGQTLAAFYGDSFTRGLGSTDPSHRWSTVVCTERGWAEFNPSVDGLGYVHNRDLVDADLVDVIVAVEPDIVIVTMGLNDNFLFPDRGSDVESAISDDFGAFANRLPDARLIVVEPFWYTEDRPASVESIIGWVRDAAERVDADYIAGASHWLDGHPEWMAEDGIHPNDRGYAEIADRMNEALDKLGA